MKKLTNKDIHKKQQAFLQKYIEYSALSLEKLKELYPKLKGSYKLACIKVTEEKLNQERINKSKDENINKEVVE